MATLTLLTQSEMADWLLKQLVIIYIYCLNFTDERSILLNIVSTINERSLISCDTSIVKLLLNGDESLGPETNNLILNVSVDFILSSKRFHGPLI